MDSTKMTDENFNPDCTDFEKNVLYKNDSTSSHENPLDDLSKQLQVLNIGDSVNSNKGRFNCQAWCTPLKSSANSNSKRLLSDITNNDSSAFQHPFNVPKKTSSVVAQEEKHTSLLENAKSNSVTNICHFPVAGDKSGNVARNETESSTISQLLNSSDGWQDPFESYSVAVGQKFFDLPSRKEKVEETELLGEKSTPDGSPEKDYVAKSVSHMKIHTPYKKNVLVRLRNSPEESEYTKKRDVLMKCDKLMAKDNEGESKQESVVNNSLGITKNEQEEVSSNNFKVETEVIDCLKLTRKESIVGETLVERDELLDAVCCSAKGSSPTNALFSKLSSRLENVRAPFDMSEDLFNEKSINISWNDDDFKNIAESVQRDLGVQPVSAPTTRHSQKVTERTTLAAHTEIVVEEKTQYLISEQEFKEADQESGCALSVNMGPVKKNVRFAFDQTFDLEVPSNDESTKILQAEDVDSDHSSDFESIHSDVDLNEYDDSMKNAFTLEDESTPTVERIGRDLAPFYVQNSPAESYDRHSMPSNVCVQSRESELLTHVEVSSVEGNVCSPTNDDCESDCSSDFESIASDTTYVAEQQNEMSEEETELQTEPCSENQSHLLELHVESSKEEVIESTSSEIREPEPMQVESLNSNLVYVEKTHIEASSTASELVCSSENSSSGPVEVTIELTETQTNSVVDVVTETSSSGVRETIELDSTTNVKHYSLHLENASLECAATSEQDEETVENVNRSHSVPEMNESNEKESLPYSTAVLPESDLEVSEQGQEKSEVAEMLTKSNENKSPDCFTAVLPNSDPEASEQSQEEIEVAEMLNKFMNIEDNFEDVIENLTIPSKLQHSTNEVISEQYYEATKVLDMFSKMINAEQTEVTSEVVERLSVSETGRTAMGLNETQQVEESSSHEITSLVNLHLSASNGEFQDQGEELVEEVEKPTVNQLFANTISNEKMKTDEDIVDMPSGSEQQRQEIHENPIYNSERTLETVKEIAENSFDDCDSSFTVASSIHKSLIIVKGSLDKETSNSVSTLEEERLDHNSSGNLAMDVEEPKPEADSSSTQASNPNQCTQHDSSNTEKTIDSSDSTQNELPSRKSETAESAPSVSTAQLDRLDFQFPDSSKPFEEVFLTVNKPESSLAVGNVHQWSEQSPQTGLNLNLEFNSTPESISNGDKAKDDQRERREIPAELSLSMKPGSTQVLMGTAIARNISMINSLLDRSLPTCSEVAAETLRRMAPVISADSECDDISPPAERTFILDERFDGGNSSLKETPESVHLVEVCRSLVQQNVEEEAGAFVQSSAHVSKGLSQMDAVLTPVEDTRKTPTKPDVAQQLDPFCTPKATGCQRSALQESAKAAKIRENFNKILTPFRDNVLRLATPRSERRSQKTETITESPSFQYEPSQDPEKMRFVLEVPTSLLDLSIAALETMSTDVKTLTTAGTKIPSNLKMDVDEAANNARTPTANHSEEIANLKQQLEDKTQALEDLSTEHEKLKSICGALYENENILKKAFEESENNNRLLSNRYEMLKDYADRFICQINEERETLATKLKSAVEELEVSRKKIENP